MFSAGRSQYDGVPFSEASQFSVRRETSETVTIGHPPSRRLLSALFLIAYLLAPSWQDSHSVHIHGPRNVMNKRLVELSLKGPSEVCNSSNCNLYLPWLGSHCSGQDASQEEATKSSIIRHEDTLAAVLCSDGPWTVPIRRDKLLGDSCPSRATHIRVRMPVLRRSCSPHLRHSDFSGYSSVPRSGSQTVPIHNYTS
ncbi:hypothetical protein BKA93DRAFT_572294 [Sparassis latifolia]